MDDLIRLDNLENLIDYDEIDLADAIIEKAIKLDNHLYGGGLWWEWFGKHIAEYEATKEAKEHVQALRTVLKEAEIKYLGAKVAKKLEQEERAFQRGQQKIDIAHRLQLSAEGLLAIMKLLARKPFSDLSIEAQENLLNALFDKVIEDIFRVGAIGESGLAMQATKLIEDGQYQ